VEGAAPRRRRRRVRGPLRLRRGVRAARLWTRVRSERTIRRRGDSAFAGRCASLAFKLELDEKQVGELAKILADLKTERAQAEVDGRRTLASFADALGREQFDETAAQQAAQLRVATAERLRDAVVQALKRLHTMLDPEQRERLAYLIRTGTLAL